MRMQTKAAYKAFILTPHNIPCPDYHILREYLKGL